MPAFSLKITPPAGKTLSTVSVATLVRSDNGLAPTGVSLPISLALTSGQWVGSFSETSPPASYFYTLLLTYTDNTTVTSSVGTLPSGTLTGIYGTISDIMLEMGKLNAEISADPDNLQDVNDIILHKQQAIDFADDEINTRLILDHYVTPATNNLRKLRFCFGKIGAFQLYQIRGLQDKKSGIGGAFQAKYDKAVEDLEELMFCNRGGFTRVAGYSDAPAGVSATVNSNGQPIRQTLRWTLTGIGIGEQMVYSKAEFEALYICLMKWEFRKRLGPERKFDFQQAIGIAKHFSDAIRRHPRSAYQANFAIDNSGYDVIF